MLKIVMRETGTATAVGHREGVDLLSRLRARRAQLLNCSGFVAEPLKGAGGNPVGAGKGRA